MLIHTSVIIVLISSYDGKDITALSDNEVTLFRKANVGFIFQQYYLLPNMNVDKNVKMGCKIIFLLKFTDIIKNLPSGFFV